jgi:uncharacterized protein (UPF0147 family)
MDDPLSGTILLSDAPIEYPPVFADPRNDRSCSFLLTPEGDTCTQTSLSDSTFCARHHVRSSTKQTSDLERFREQMILNAKHDLLRMVPTAAATIAQLIEDEDVPANVRLKAATEVLDRVGVRGGTEIDIRAEVTSDPSADIRRRLEAMAESLRVVVEPEPASAPAPALEATPDDPETDDQE